MNKKKVIKGGLIAAAAGFVAGILLAPKSGKETRKDIKNVAARGKKSAEKELKELFSEVEGLSKDVKQKVTSATGATKKEMVQLRDELEVAQARVKVGLSDLRDGLVDDEAIQKLAKHVKELSQKAKKQVKG